MACDIGNAFLNVPNRERVHVIVGKELFGPEYENKRAVVVRALYGLKSASAALRHHFAATTTNDLGYKSTVADPEVYFKPKVKPDDFKYYACLIVYVDDVLSIDLKPEDAIDKISNIFRIKEGSVKSPDMYLDMGVKKRTI